MILDQQATPKQMDKRSTALFYWRNLQMDFINKTLVQTLSRRQILLSTEYILSLQNSIKPFNI